MQIYFSSFSQVFQKYEEQGHIFGLNLNSYGSYFCNPETQEKKYDYSFSFQPYYGYTFVNLTIGLTSKYSFYRNHISDSSLYKNHDFFELGGFVRYTYLFRINTYKKDLGTRYFIFFSEIAPKASNYRLLNKDREFISTKGLDYYLITVIPIAVQFNFWKGLHGELSLEWNYYAKGYNNFTYRIGLEYKLSNKLKK